MTVFLPYRTLAGGSARGSTISLETTKHLRAVILPREEGQYFLEHACPG